MQRLKNFNNISDELLASIPPLKEGEVKSFRMLNGVPYPDPDFEERQKRPVLYGGLQIRTFDRIKDPYKTNEKGDAVGGYVDIGVIEEFDPISERPIKFKLFVVGQGVGQFLLSGNRPEDVELYEYLYLCKYNKKNNKTNDALFEEIIYKSEDETMDDEIKLFEKANATLKKADINAVVGIGAALKWDVSQDEQTLRKKLFKIVKDEPQKFLDLYKSVTSRKKNNKPKEVELEEEISA